MEIYQLRTFVAVAKHGHITQAAEALHLSQPTVSNQVRALEDELGAELFKRCMKGVTLTPCGHDLLKPAQEILEAVDQFIERGKRFTQQPSGTVRLGTIISSEFLRLGELMSAVRDLYPKIEVELHHGLSGLIIRSVQRNELDAGFVLWTAKIPKITTIDLRSVGFCVIAPAKWKRRISGLGWKQIAELPWVCTPKLGAYHQVSRQMFRRHNVTPSTVVETDREATIMNLVASGVGLGLMREEALLASPDSKGVTLWPKGRVDATLSFVFRKDRQNETPIRALVDAVRSIWRVAA